MKLNNEVMLIGVACLIVGGAAGYLLSGQNQEEYIAKGVNSGLTVGKEIGCYLGVATEAEFETCVEAANSESEYLTKKVQNAIGTGSSGGGGGGGSSCTCCSPTCNNQWGGNPPGTNCAMCCAVHCSE